MNVVNVPTIDKRKRIPQAAIDQGDALHKAQDFTVDKPPTAAKAVSRFPKI